MRERRISQSEPPLQQDSRRALRRIWNLAPSLQNMSAAEAGAFKIYGSQCGS
jgi:hypothetical protein